ncbi:hypothetical protein H4CHR_01382 [Variovorax sp. PBS-H4]|uniref:DUF3606 domain-containing protein n=1 Tax=Variovorax sp. PBS-H4 TaxID=434008 RepID=UPI001318162A|nr:DUF3606 domain-containing protein [Variovorax sp. PBS-H4]VTU24380.1 hypothetical protein H4CHR_01382 [Variovorax sp. PBS-H4]
MPQNQASSQAESIDVSSTRAVEDLARRFDATPEQIREAVKAVGSRVADVELHLKGTRSASNEQRVDSSP